MLWNFVIGPAGALCFGAAFLLGVWAAIQRERSAPPRGGSAQPRPYLYGALVLMVVFGAVASVLRMGALT